MRCLVSLYFFATPVLEPISSVRPGLDVEVVPLVLRLLSGALGVCLGRAVVRVRDRRQFGPVVVLGRQRVVVYFTHIYESAQQKRLADTGDSGRPLKESLPHVERPRSMQVIESQDEQRVHHQGRDVISSHDGELHTGRVALSLTFRGQSYAIGSEMLPPPMRIAAYCRDSPAAHAHNANDVRRLIAEGLTARGFSIEFCQGIVP